MNASCAVCQQPLQKGEPIRLAGHEVVHRACLGNLSESVYWRQRRRLDDMDRDISSLQFKLADAQQRCNTLGRDAEWLREARSEMARRHDEITVGLAGDLRRATAAIQDAQRERDEARRQLRDALLPGVMPAMHSLSTGLATPPGDPPAPKDERDDTEVRFSLIELDLS